MHHFMTPGTWVFDEECGGFIASFWRTGDVILKIPTEGIIPVVENYRYGEKKRYVDRYRGTPNDQRVIYTRKILPLPAVAPNGKFVLEINKRNWFLRLLGYEPYEVTMRSGIDKTPRCLLCFSEISRYSKERTPFVIQKEWTTAEIILIKEVPGIGLLSGEIKEITFYGIALLEPKQKVVIQKLEDDSRITYEWSGENMKITEETISLPSQKTIKLIPAFKWSGKEIEVVDL